LRSSEGHTVGRIELRVNSMFFEGPKCKNDDDVRPTGRIAILFVEIVARVHVVFQSKQEPS
jgi:hypothetical protein